MSGERKTPKPSLFQEKWAKVGATGFTPEQDAAYAEAFRAALTAAPIIKTRLEVAALDLLTALDEHEDEAEMNNRDDYAPGAADRVYTMKAALRAALEAK